MAHPTVRMQKAVKGELKRLGLEDYTIEVTKSGHQVLKVEVNGRSRQLRFSLTPSDRNAHRAVVSDLRRQYRRWLAE